ncbi:MAG TPA: protein YgfX [Burkholderiales bacterium]|nr:protein YgfX [Burkholderiales bacterium]
MLRIPFAASRSLAILLVIVHSVAGVCVVAFVPAWWAVAMLIGALCTSVVFHLRRDALRLSDNAVIEVTLRDDGRCELLTRGAAVLNGTVAGSSFISAWFTVLNVRLDDSGTLRSVAVMPDCADAEDRRRLRVWLRYRTQPEMPDSSTL